MGRLARWSVRLQQYDFRIVHRRGKENVVPDLLSRSVPVVDCVAEMVVSGGKANGKVTDTVSDKWYLRMFRKVEENPLQFSNWRIEDGKLYNT